MNLLTLKEVYTYYGTSEILHGVNLILKEKSITCLLGKNGMGKSTMLRSIMGLTSCKNGEILFRDKRIDALKPDTIFNLGIGYVPQGRRLFPNMTVGENLRMGLKDKSEKNPSVFNEIFDVFPILEERMLQKAGTLSGGQQQMLAISRALAGRPQLLLVDEPTEGIQPSIVDDILRQLSWLNESMGLSLLLVEQNIDLAISIAQEYLIMNKGLIVDTGSIEDMDRQAVINKYLVV